MFSADLPQLQGRGPAVDDGRGHDEVVHQAVTIVHPVGGLDTAGRPQERLGVHGDEFPEVPAGVDYLGRRSLFYV